MKLVNIYEYPTLIQITSETERRYVTPENHKLPSVTTILGQTGDKTGLTEWRERVGNQEADRISSEAAGLGTLVHKHLECELRGELRPTGNNMVRKLAREMADQVINRAFHKIQEVWALETALYFPELYAGTADVIGVYNNEPAIMDFKTARKMKKEEWIQDYRLQLSAYALAHNELFGTNIKKGVIFMVDRNYSFSEFSIEGKIFDESADLWCKRVEEWYAQQ